MSLRRVRITALRCVAEAELHPHPARNFIYGPNGAGKTTILEGLYLLGRGRSFRTRQIRRLVRKGAEDPYAPPAGKGEEAASDRVHGEGGSRYRIAYYSFPEDFTSNLRNSEGMVQLSLAASTRYDGRVLMWLDEQGNTVGHYDVFDYIRDARAHYKDVGIADDYLDSLMR